MSTDENEIQLDFCERSAKFLGYNILIIHPDGREDARHTYVARTFISWKAFSKDVLQIEYPLNKFIICKVMMKDYGHPYKYIPLTEFELFKYK